VELAGLYIFSYLVGAIPTAYLMGRLVKGIDLRQYGTGNVGGTNLFYHVGKRWLVVLVLFEVFVKGGSPIWVGRYLLALEWRSVSLAVAPLLAVVGNNWSVYLRFQGGRGITVAGGTLLFLAPLLLAAFIGVGVAGWALTRSSGVWVLTSLALLPLWAVIFGMPSVVTWYCVAILVLIVLKRLVSNWTPLPEGLPRKKVLFNRLFLDRDLDDHDQWIKRVPRGTNTNSV
jgi:glycerol-3-phosphate acyltransferase PlsY